MDEHFKKLSIPKELFHPFFFTENETIIVRPIDSFNCRQYFLNEILYYNGITAYKPWVAATESIPIILKEWQSLKVEIESMHRNKEKNDVIQTMKKGISLFMQMLFWSNETPVCLKVPFNFSDLIYKPMNVEERITFTLERPGLFHSYIQLTELFIEQEKLFFKKIVIKKASRPKV